MNYRVLQRIFCTTRALCLIVAITGTLFSVCFVAVQSASAAELTLPQELTHEGLTFSSSLHFSSEHMQSEITFLTVKQIQEDTTVEEVASEEPEPTLLVQATKEDEVLVEEIVLPTPKKLAHNASLKDAGGASLTPLPTKKLTPTPTSPQVLVATSAPQVTPTTTTTPPTPTNSSLPAYATNGTLSAETLFSMVNQKRADAGLPAFEKNDQVCAVAEQRKPQIENEVYGSSSIHAGFRAMDLPFRASENMISQNSEEAALNWWMNSSIHKAGILGASKYGCVVCQNKTCAMIMSSLDPK